MNNNSKNRCPKCGEKLRATYMKQTCPNCQVNLLYYKMDERLEADAANAKHEVEKVKRFFDVIKKSTIASPLHIIRLILFFAPLASMCLPVFWAGHKNVSLISFIMSIVNHGFDLGAMAKDKAYLFAIGTMAFVILLSIAVIISSLFSSAKKGFRRNIVFSSVNTAVFILMSFLVLKNGGYAKLGFYLTLLIYAFEILLHFAVSKPKNKKRFRITAAMLAVCLIITPFEINISLNNKKTEPLITLKNYNYDVDVVSFNVAAPWGSAFDDTASEKRVIRFIDYMNDVAPKLIATQEMNSFWLNKIKEQMPEYEAYAVKRGGDSDENTSEMNAIFWKSEDFIAVETNTFWLSETPDIASKYTYLDEKGEQQEAGCNRICTYAVLKDAEENLLAFLNTHLDNASEQAMNYGAELIVNKIGEIKERYGKNINIILTGDFNQTSDGDAYKTIASHLNDCTHEASEQATWQDWGYTNTGDKPIDFIFTNGRRNEYIVLKNINNGYVSDHYGILAEIDYNNGD